MWLFGGTDPPENDDSEPPPVTASTIGAAFSDGFRKDGNGQLPEPEPPSPAMSSRAVPPLRPAGRRPSDAPSGGSGSGSARMQASPKRAAPRFRRPRWENDDSDDENTAKNPRADAGGETDPPAEAVSLGRYPWEAAAQMQVVDEGGEDFEDATEGAEAAMKARRPSVPNHWPFLSETATKDVQREEKEPQAGEAINELDEEAPPLASYEQAVLDLQPVQRSQAAQSAMAQTSGVPTFLALKTTERNQALADGRDWQHSREAAERDDEEDEDSEDKEGGGDDNGEDGGGDGKLFAQKSAMKEEVRLAAERLTEEQNQIFEHDRRRKLDDISTKHASRIIQEVIKVKKGYVDSRMKLFEDSQKMGREAKLRERKIMSWIAIASVLNKFDQQLKSPAIEEEMNKAYLLSLPPPPPPPPKGQAPSQEDEDLHEQYERMRLRFAPAWEQEGRMLLGEAKYKEIRSMASGPADKQKRLIAEKCFDEAMTVMSEKEHVDLLRRAWRLENNWQPLDMCDPLAFAQDKMKKMHADEAAALKGKRMQAKHDQQNGVHQR